MLYQLFAVPSGIVRQGFFLHVRVLETVLARGYCLKQQWEVTHPPLPLSPAPAMPTTGPQTDVDGAGHELSG